MTDINKQTFLAELGKLLTFMYEEDRQRAVAMYAKMFDDAPDEQALLQALGSPTRQAVNVARAYNAKERKLQVEAQTREVRPESSSQGTPDYVLVINKIYQEAIPDRTSEAEPMEDQFSLFDEMTAPEESAEQPEAAAEQSEEAAEEPAPAAEEPVLAESEPAESEPAPAEESEESPEEEIEETPEEAPEDTPEEPAPTAEEPEAPRSEAPAPESEEPQAEEPEAPAEEAAEEPAPATQDEVDAFIAEFLIENDELAEAEAEPEAEAADEPVLAEPVPVEEPKELPAEEPEEVRLVRKPRVFLLILYILLAVPITLLGLVILLIPTLLVLALALVVISAGSALAFTAFTGFSILADILIVAGAAFIVLGLGLLVLWTFVWFIGGPIVGLIRGVCALGRKWCYKEVAA